MNKEKFQDTVTLAYAGTRDSFEWMLEGTDLADVMADVDGFITGHLRDWMEVHGEEAEGFDLLEAYSELVEYDALRKALSIKPHRVTKIYETTEETGGQFYLTDASLEENLELLRESFDDPSIDESIFDEISIEHFVNNRIVWGDTTTEDRALIEAELAAYVAEQHEQAQAEAELAAVMTAAEAAEEFGVSPATVTTMCTRGSIPARKAKGTWLIRRADAVARWGGKVRGIALLLVSLTATYALWVGLFA